MNVRGLHGVPKELLIKPTVKESADGRGSARKLALLDRDAHARPRVDAHKEPRAALSNAVRYAREQCFVKVRRATDRHYRKLKASGRLFEARFGGGSKLGFRLHVAAYSKDSAVRECLEVEETSEDCPFWPDRIRPTDELVMINGALVVEPSRESFPAIVDALAAAPRPLVLTFATGLNRAAAFAAQQQRRGGAGLGHRPATAAVVEDNGEADEEEAAFGARLRQLRAETRDRLAEAAALGELDGEREVNSLLEQESCPCFHFHLGLAARKCSECEPVDANRLLADAALRPDQRVGMQPAYTELVVGQLVKVRPNLPQPRLGWYAASLPSSPPKSIPL